MEGRRREEGGRPGRRLAGDGAAGGDQGRAGRGGRGGGEQGKGKEEKGESKENGEGRPGSCRGWGAVGGRQSGCGGRFGEEVVDGVKLERGSLGIKGFKQG